MKWWYFELANRAVFIEQNIDNPRTYWGWQKSEIGDILIDIGRYIVTVSYIKAGDASETYTDAGRDRTSKET